MNSKTILTTSSIMITVLVIGLVSSPMITKTYAVDYDGYKNYGKEIPYNGYGDYNKEKEKVKVFPPPGFLTAEWWQWVIDIPPEINPLLDQTGENCDVNQQGKVWFLAGTLGGSAERECTIPEGKKILFPIINTFCAELTDEFLIKEALGIPADQPIPPSQLEEGLRACAESLIDPVDILEVSIDGKQITNLEDFRVQSPLFTISYPENNVFGVTENIDIPQQAISDGYWVLVKGLKPGEHTIEFTGGISEVFETHVTYHITIEPTNDNKYNNNYYEDNYGKSYNNNGYNNNNYY